MRDNEALKVLAQTSMDMNQSMQICDKKNFSNVVPADVSKAIL